MAEYAAHDSDSMRRRNKAIESVLLRLEVVRVSQKAETAAGYSEVQKYAICPV